MLPRASGGMALCPELPASCFRPRCCKATAAKTRQAVQSAVLHGYSRLMYEMDQSVTTYAVGCGRKLWFEAIEENHFLGPAGFGMQGMVYGMEASEREP